MLPAWPAIGAAQRVPGPRAEVAQPGGRIPGAQPLALVQAVRGFRDPTGVTAAADGSGRLFAAERAGRVPLVLAGGGGGGAPLAVIGGPRKVREHPGGGRTATLLAGIGRGVEVRAMDGAVVAGAIRWPGEREERP